jgi:6-phosphofructokinase 1
MKKKIGILTGGGDVSPLNAVLAGASKAAARYGIELIGFLKGWEGILENRYVSLRTTMINPIIGGTILKSSRINLSSVPGGSASAVSTFKRMGLSGLIVIGGEDTLSNSFLLKEFPQVLISKTIDNDVGVFPDDRPRVDMRKIINYFTLGYPTAAAHIANFVSLPFGMRSTAYSHERIIIVEAMGMHAGWLALASSIGSPDFIVIPEFPLDYEVFKELVAQKYRDQRHVIAVIAEGARWKNGTYVSANENEKDNFGHPRFIGSAKVLAERLRKDLDHRFDTRNINFVNPSYLYRSGPPNILDLRYAQALGKKAVQLLAKNLDLPSLLTVQKNSTAFDVVPYSLSSVGGMEELHRYVSRTLYSEEQFAVTREGKRYLSYIVSALPSYRYGLNEAGVISN